MQLMNAFGVIDAISERLRRLSMQLVNAFGVIDAISDAFGLSMQLSTSRRFYDALAGDGVSR